MTLNKELLNILKKKGFKVKSKKIYWIEIVKGVPLTNDFLECDFETYANEVLKENDKTID
jgi:hypothetical protein